MTRPSPTPELRTVRNESGIPLQPAYTAADGDAVHLTTPNPPTSDHG